MTDYDDAVHQAPSMAPPEKGTSRAFVMAAAMHVVLILALVIGLHWNTERPAAAQAELWSTLPPPAASVKPPPAPAPAPTPAPKPQPAPVVEQGPTDAEIAIAKSRQQAIERQRAERQVERKRQADTQRRLEQQSKALARQAEQLAQREAAQQRAADTAKQVQVKQAQAKQQALAKANAEAAAKQEQHQLNALKTRLRQDALKSAGVGAGVKAASVDGAAAKPIGNPNGQANATGNGRGDSGYGDLIRACVRPGVVFSPPIDIDGNPTAEFAVQLLPNGEQVGAPRLVKSSGISNFDNAVEKGIRRCNPFPRPPSGNVEDGIIIGYRMFD